LVEGAGGIYLSYVLDLLVNKFRQENDMLAEKIAELKEKLIKSDKT